MLRGFLPRRLVPFAFALTVALAGSPADAAAQGDKKEKEADADGAADAELELDAQSSDDADAAKQKKAKKKKKKKKLNEGAAADMKGRTGFGAMRTLSALNAIGVRHYVHNRLTIGGAAGFAMFTHQEDGDSGDFDARRTVGLVGFGPELFYWPAQGSRSRDVYADFGFGARALVFFGFNTTTGGSDDENDLLDNPLEIDIELPMTTQVWIGQRFAIIPEWGLVFRFIPGSREPDQQGNSDENPGRGIGERLGTDNGPGFGFEMGEHTGLFLGLSLMYFFGELPG